MYEESKTHMIKKQIKKHIENYNQSGLYTLFDSEFAKKLFAQEIPCYKLSYFYDLLLEWDEKTAVPKEIGEYIENIINDKNYRLGIHRTILENSVLENERIKNILTVGLKNFSNPTMKTDDKLPNLSTTISIPNNILNAFILLKSTFKSLQGAFILAIPREFINEDGTIVPSDINEIYDFIDGIPHIKPKYILGYIDIDSNIMNYTTKETILSNKKRM